MFFPEISKNLTDEDVLKEHRKTPVCSISQNILDFELVFKFSSWTKLRRNMAWYFRFSKDIRHPSELIISFLTVSELEKATNTINSKTLIRSETENFTFF